MDLSPLRKFEVTGPDAEALLQYALTRDVRKLAVGQVVYTAMCYEHGGMIDDGTLFRLGENNFRWIGGDDYGGIWLREQAEKLGLKAWVRSSTDQLHNVAVQGPKSRDILREVVWTPPAQPTLDELGWFRFTIGRIGGFEGAPVVVSRTGYTGELGYEIFCHPKDALTVFDAIWQAGEPHGLMPLGLQALDMVRIEAGLIFAGYEFCDQTDPFEAGIGFTVPLTAKNEDFIGREALLRRKEHPQKTLVGLEMEGDETVGHGDCVHIGRAQIGVVTSATRSPILKKTIALARRRRHPCRDRHRGRGRQARRPSEALARTHRALPALRSGEDAGACVIGMIRAVLLDLAGVVYQGDQPLPGAVDAVACLRQAGLRLRFLTNTTRMPRRALLSRLADMGIRIADEELFTPAQAAMRVAFGEATFAPPFDPPGTSRGLREPPGLRDRSRRNRRRSRRLHLRRAQRGVPQVAGGRGVSGACAQSQLQGRGRRAQPRHRRLRGGAGICRSARGDRARQAGSRFLQGRARQHRNATARRR